MNTETRLLTPKDAAKYIGMSAGFLAVARCHGNLSNRTPAPPFIRIGRTIRYDLQELDEWIDARAKDTRGNGF